MFVLTLLLVIVFTASGVAANKAVEAKRGTAVDGHSPADFEKAAKVYDDITGTYEPVSAAAKGSVDDRGTVPASLGAYSQDGGSPGFIVGRTFRDLQHNGNPGRMVESRTGPVVHFAWTNQVFQGMDPQTAARWTHYNAFDPTISPNGVFVNGAMGLTVHASPLTRTGAFVQLDVDESGRAVCATQDFNADGSGITVATAYYDIGSYTFLGIAADSNIAVDPAGDIMWPRLEYQDYAGTQVTHMAAIETGGYLTYWRKVGSSIAGSWSTQTISDDIKPVSHQVASSAVSGDVAIVWLEDLDDTYEYGSQVCYKTSTDQGATWGPEQHIVGFNSGDTCWVAWIEAGCLYDTDGYLHIVYNSNRYIPGVGAVEKDPARILHWSERNPGYTSTIQYTDFARHGNICGAGGWNTLTVAQPVISECNDRLYTIWQQFGDPSYGDSLDCANLDMMNAWNAYNADIYMAVSSTRDGLFWDRPRNLTNSKTPDCDTTESNECDHDVHATLSRYGVSHGPAYWSGVPEAFDLRDILAPGYPDDDYYLDLLYINDLVPDNAPYGQFDGSAAPWTYNPVKWARTPCVLPVIEPEAYIPTRDFLWPRDWVKSGDEEEVDVVLNNFGNATLTVNAGTTIHQGPGGCVDVNPTFFSIPAGGSDVAYVTVNVGGMVNPPAGTAVAIEADVAFSTDDPENGTLIYTINTVVADTVVQVTWDTLQTGLGMALTVGRNGNAGNTGNAGFGMANMDFVTPDYDCDSSATVYLFDGTPIIMRNGGADYSWQPYHDSETPEPYHFQPVADGVNPDHWFGANYEAYRSGTFVTSDSAIGMTKIWYAPDGAVSYVLVRTDVYSYDATTYNNVHIGELFDWDIPSDSMVDNEGGFAFGPDGTSYLYHKGLEYHDDDPPACIDSDLRLGGTGMLGYYYDSEIDSDPMANNTGLYSGNILLANTLLDPYTKQLYEDSAWSYMTSMTGLSVDNTEAADQVMLLGFGDFTIEPTDTLRIWTVHASVYDGDDTDFDAMIDDAYTWYLDNRVESPFECGCGNYNCSVDGKVNLADITRLIDYLYISHLPLPGTDADMNMDQCDGVDVADLMALWDKVYWAKGDYCNGMVNCDFEGVGDTVELVVARRPSVSGGQMDLQLDLYVRNHRNLIGANMGFGWDNPNLSFDSAVTTALIETGLDYAHTASAAHLTSASSSMACLRLAPAWMQTSRRNGSGPATSLHCLAGALQDSIVIDTVLYEGGCTIKLVTSPTDMSNPDSLGYVPAWEGGLIIRDPSVYGNVDGSPGVDIGDVIYMVDYFYVGGPPPEPWDVADIDQCRGVDIGDMTHLIEYLFRGGPEPCPDNPNCDCVVEGDNMVIEEDLIDDNHLRMDLMVFNSRPLLGASIGFGWDDPNVVLDSAVATELVTTAFDQGPHFFEDDNIATANANRRCLFSAAKYGSGTGLAADTLNNRLWASYYFSSSTKFTASMEMVVDTFSFSDASNYKLVIEEDDGSTTPYQPVMNSNWFCCGMHTGNFTGNVNWNSDRTGCDPAGTRNLADISRLIDRIYISHRRLCCEKNGDVNNDGKWNMADISKLINHVFLQKLPHCILLLTGVPESEYRSVTRGKMSAGNRSLLIHSLRPASGRRIPYEITNQADSGHDSIDIGSLRPASLSDILNPAGAKRCRSIRVNQYRGRFRYGHGCHHL